MLTTLVRSDVFIRIRIVIAALDASIVELNLFDFHLTFLGQNYSATNSVPVQ